jgi:chemotaxis signal transduction protein
MKELHGLYEMDGNEKSTAEHHLHPEIVDEVVIFSLRKQEFAFRTERIKEIIDISEITMVVDVDSSVKGVTNVRGQVVPVFALNDRLGLDTSKATDMYRLIICENGDELMGIIVDEVNDIRQIQPHEVEEDDSTTQGVLNVLKLENGKRLAVLLDEVMLLAS